MALMHVMPEAAGVYEGWAKCEKIENPFPLPYLMYMVGYVFILIIDKWLAASLHLDADTDVCPDDSDAAEQHGNQMEVEGP